MPKFISLSRLKMTKERLGPFNFLDFRELDLITAHHHLGKSVGEQAQKILRRKLDGLSREGLLEKVGLARGCRRLLSEKSRAPNIDPRLRAAFGEYLACLSAWAGGARLEEFQHRLLREVRAAGQPVAAEELALFLQNDNVGCQTGVYRDREGAVILWHTEEDVEAEPGSRFDRLRLAIFQTHDGAGPVEIRAFIYPDLLPGPAYGWRSDGFLQAVDSLPLKAAGGAFMLANIATWVTLRLGQAVEPEAVTSALAPFFDGYALTAVRAKNEQIIATKIEFAGDQSLRSTLAPKPGSYLFQVNIFSDERAAVARAYEDSDRESRSGLQQRLARTVRALKSLPLAQDAPACFSRLLASRLGDDYAYANEDVKSYFLGKLSPRGLEVHFGAGPALADFGF